MSTRSTLLLGLAVLAGCATRADLVSQDRRLRNLIQEQKRQMQSMQREVERLRAEVEGGGGSGRRPTGGERDRLHVLEERLSALERGQPVPPSTDTGELPPAEEETPPAGAVATATTTPPFATPTTTKPPEDDAWRRDVAREQAEAGTVNVPERTAYLALLDGVAKKDCQRTVPQLNTFASTNKESPLASNAVYWAARCYAATGDQNNAVQKFYDVVTRYPKSKKAPAALWAQGNIFVGMGDAPDARLAFSKLIRDYPNSEEAALARQKLTQLEN